MSAKYFDQRSVNVCMRTRQSACMAGRFNIYSQLVISAIRIADITNCE